MPSSCGSFLENLGLRKERRKKVFRTLTRPVWPLGTWRQGSWRSNRGGSTRSTWHGSSAMRNQRLSPTTMSKEHISTLTTRAPGANARKPISGSSTSSSRTNLSKNKSRCEPATFWYLPSLLFSPSLTSKSVHSFFYHLFLPHYCLSHFSHLLCLSLALYLSLSPSLAPCLSFFSVVVPSSLPSIPFVMPSFALFNKCSFISSFFFLF